MGKIRFLAMFAAMLPLLPGCGGILYSRTVSVEDGAGRSYGAADAPATPGGTGALSEDYRMAVSCAAGRLVLLRQDQCCRQTGTDAKVMRQEVTRWREAARAAVPQGHDADADIDATAQAISQAEALSRLSVCPPTP
jgi:hypothetical protein